jgi:hypothetical protein
MSANTEVREGEEVEVVRLGKSGHEKEEALDVTIERGYLFWVRPDNAEAIDCSIEHTDENGQTYEEPHAYGYHGTDTPPCEGEYVGAEDGGYLVIYEEPEIQCVDGWTSVPADLSVGWHTTDGTWSVVVVKAPLNGPYTIAGLLS